jgi:hypothetical protein
MTTRHTFGNIWRTIQIRRLLRLVQVENDGITPIATLSLSEGQPRLGSPPQSDCAQRRIEPADLRATHPSPPTPIPYAGDSFCSPIFGGLTSSRNGLLGTVL